jgi:hypothetical protein
MAAKDEQSSAVFKNPKTDAVLDLETVFHRSQWPRIASMGYSELNQKIPEWG